MGIQEILSHVLGVTDVKLINQGYASIIATIAVMFGWYVSRRGQIIAERVKNTIGFEHILNSKEMIEDLNKIGKHIRSGEFPDEIYKNSEIQASLAAVLNKVEGASAAISAGFISEKYHLSLSRTFYEHLFIASAKYIAHARKEGNSKTFYIEYETFYIRNFIRKFRPIATIIEAIYAYPIFKVEYKIFKIEYFIICHIFKMKRNFLDETMREVVVARRLMYLMLYFYSTLLIVSILMAT
jgi:hypothetical protein